MEEYDTYSDYGWANSWKETPQAVHLCWQKKHPRTDVDIGPPFRGLHHVVRCPICKIVYHYDSSD